MSLIVTSLMSSTKSLLFQSCNRFFTSLLKVRLSRLLQWWVHNIRTWPSSLHETSTTTSSNQTLSIVVPKWTSTRWLSGLRSTLQFSCFFQFLMPAPRSLNKTCCPRSPMMWMMPELVPKLLAMQSPKLWSYKCQVLSNKCKCLYFSYSLDRACRWWKNDS